LGRAHPDEVKVNVSSGWIAIPSGPRAANGPQCPTVPSLVDGADTILCRPSCC